MSASRWKSFWITFAIFGAVNCGLFAYFLSLPVQRVGKRGLLCRDNPEWYDRTVFGLNFPGAIIATGIFWAIDPEFTPASQAVGMGVVQFLGALSWATIAARVVSPVNPPAESADVTPDSN